MFVYGDKNGINKINPRLGIGLVAITDYFLYDILDYKFEIKLETSKLIRGRLNLYKANLMATQAASLLILIG